MLRGRASRVVESGRMCIPHPRAQRQKSTDPLFLDSLNLGCSPWVLSLLMTVRALAWVTVRTVVAR